MLINCWLKFSALLTVRATLFETNVIERSEENDHTNFDINALYALIDSKRTTFPDEITIGELGAFVLINNEDGLAIDFAAPNIGVYENNGDFYILDNSKNLKNNYKFNSYTFTNNKVFQYGLEYLQTGSDLNIEFTNFQFINNGIMRFWSNSNIEIVGIVNFGSTNLMRNDQAICLNRFQASTNIGFIGSGCIVLDNTSILRLIGSAPAPIDRLTQRADTDLQIYMKNYEAIIHEDVNFQRGTMYVYGFGNGNRIVLNADIQFRIYDPINGILDLHTSGGYTLYTIGTGYDVDSFVLKLYYSTSGTDSIIFYDSVPEGQVIPDKCMLCDQQFNDYSYLNDPYAVYLDETNKEIELISTTDGAWFTTTMSAEIVTVTTYIAPQDLWLTRTYLYDYYINENSQVLTDISQIIMSTIDTLTTYETTILQQPTKVTAYIIQTQNEDGEWISIHDPYLIGIGTKSTRIVQAEPLQTNDVEILAYTYAARVHYITNTLPDPVEATISTVIEDGDRTEVVIVTSNEENWWFTTTETIPRSSYTYTTRLSDEEGITTATHIISAGQNEEEEWITRTSTHIPSHITSLVTIEDEATTYTALHYEYLPEDGDWITTTDSNLIKVETFTSRVTLTNEGGEYIKDAEIMRYEFAEAGNFFVTSFLDDPVEATISTVIEDGDRTEVIIVTSDEKNWWYTTTETIPRSSYTFTTRLSDEEGITTATHIISAGQNEEEEWITRTSTHIPSHITSLLTVEEEATTYPALHYEYLPEDGDWITTTDTVLVSIETFTSRVTLVDEGGEYIKDAEIMRYEFAEAGNFFVTSLLDDPIATSITNVDDKGNTKIVIVTSDPENWWFTTTTVITPELTTAESQETELETYAETHTNLPSSTSSIVAMPTESIVSEMPFELVLEFEYQLLRFTSNGTHLTLLNGDSVWFTLEDGFLRVSEMGYVQIDETGLLLIKPKDEATLGWSIEDGNKLYFIDELFTDLKKRDYKVYFSFCEDGYGGYVIYAGRLGCEMIEEVAALQMFMDETEETEIMNETTIESNETGDATVYETSLIETFETTFESNETGDVNETSLIETSATTELDQVSMTNEVIETGEDFETFDWLDETETIAPNETFEINTSDAFTTNEAAVSSSFFPISQADSSTSISSGDSNSANLVYVDDKSSGSGILMTSSSVLPQETQISLEYITKVITDCGTKQCNGEDGTPIETITYCGDKECDKATQEIELVSTIQGESTETVTNCGTKDCHNDKIITNSVQIHNGKIITDSIQSQNESQLNSYTTYHDTLSTIIVSTSDGITDENAKIETTSISTSFPTETQNSANKNNQFISILVLTFILNFI